MELVIRCSKCHEELTVREDIGAFQWLAAPCSTCGEEAVDDQVATARLLTAALVDIMNIKVKIEAALGTSDAKSD